MASKPEPKPDEPTPDEPKADAEPKGEEALTPERFEELRREAIKHRREARAAQTAADEVRAELERLRVERESDQERAVREAVEEARREEAAKWDRRLLEAEVAVRAAGKLADPSDAVHLLPVDDLLAEPEPDARQRKIDEALSDLIEAKPYLAAANGPARPATGLVTQGTRSKPPVSGDASADDWIRSHSRRR